MAWLASNITPPGSGDAIESAAAGAVASAAGDLDGATGRVDAVAADVSYTLSPVAGAAAGSSTQADALADLLGPVIDVIAVSPFTDGVGEGLPRPRYLSGTNLKRALAEKANDRRQKPGVGASFDAIGIMVAAKSLAALQSKLHALNQVLPIPEFKMAERKATRLQALNDTKVVKPSPAILPRWRRWQLTQLSRARNAQTLIGQRVAMAAAYEDEAITPLDELKAVIEKKKQRIQYQAAAYAAWAGEISGGIDYAIFVGGTNQDGLTNALQQGGAGNEFSLCAGALLLSAPGKLQFLKELLGL